MRGALLLLGLLLLPFAVAAEEKKESGPPPKPKVVDPVKLLPVCLQPGTTAVYDRAASGKTALAGTVTYRAKAGADRDMVELSLEYDTGDRGVLTFRDRLVAHLNARSKLLTFEYAIGGKKGEPYVNASRLEFVIDRKGEVRLYHSRFTYGKKGEEPRVKKTRLKADGAWVPQPLEPFLVALHEAPEAQPFTLKLMTVLTGTIGKKPVRYRPLGEGKMRIGEKDTECRIFSRVRGDDRSMVYLRKSDSLPLKANGLTLRPAEKKQADAKKEKKDK